MQTVEQIGKVLDMILCPACRGRLELRSLPDPESTASALSNVRCAACGKSYPVEDGIPVLLDARATNPSQ